VDGLGAAGDAQLFGGVDPVEAHGRVAIWTMAAIWPSALTAKF